MHITRYAPTTGTEAVTGLRITVSGDIEIAEFTRTPEGSTRHALYEAIGCTTVDCVQVQGTLDHGGIDVWLDGEGLLTQQPINPLASRLINLQLDIPSQWRQPYCGTAVLLGFDRAGGTCSLDFGRVGITPPEIPTSTQDQLSNLHHRT